MITLLPAFLTFSLINDFKRFLELKKIMLLLSFFLFGISLYLCLPIRSNLSPAINWGRPDSLANIFSYITRSSQSTSVATSSHVPYLNRFWFTLSFPVIQFSLPLFWLGVLGAYAMFKESKRFFIFTFLLFIFNLFTATWATDFSLRNYDLLGYLLPSLSIFAIWFAFGIFFIFALVRKNVVDRLVGRSEIPLHSGIPSHPSGDHKGLPYILKFFLCGLILLLPIYQIARNFDQCNERSNIWAYQYANQILNSVKKDALILAGDDNTLTTLWYLNYAEKKRPDVKIISSSALSQKSYRDQLREQYRKLRLPKTELANSQNSAYDICRLNIDKMPVYCQYYSTDTVFAHHVSPMGYIFEYHPERVALSNSDIQMQKEFLEKNLKNKRFDPITKEHFGNLIFNMGVFYNQLGISNISLEYLLMALDIDPSNSRIYAQLGKAFLKMGETSKAKEFFQAALELDPYNQDAKRALENI
jgi:tetratricopeptide (TPR) repeat protein